MPTYSILRQITTKTPDGYSAISWQFVAALPAANAIAALEKAKRIHKRIPSGLLAVELIRVH